MAGNEGQGAGAGPASDRPGGPRADDVDGCITDVLEATVFDREVACELHAMGILSWDTIRALFWMRYKLELGRTPNFDAPVELGARRDIRTVETGA